MSQAKQPSRLHWYDLWRMVQTLVGVWAFAGALVFLVATPLLNPPMQDAILLLVFLGLSGSASILLAYLAYRLGLVSRVRRLRYTLIILTALTIALFFLNVWVTAQLMFIDQHDLGLTTVLLVFAGGTALGFGYFISSALTERITGVAEGARELSKGDLSTRVPVQGNDELAELAATFNIMAARLQEIDEQKRMLEQTRRDLVAWVSHDLRTPLASLRLVIDALVDGVVQDEETTWRYLATAQNEIRNLNDLINDLFELAQIDVGHVNLRLERTSFNDLVSDTLSAMRALAERRGVRLTGSVDERVDPVMVDPEKIQRVLSNLLANAIRHTPTDGEVSLSAKLAGDSVRVEVRDTGEGIAPGDLPHIFERFYRGQPARTRDGEGQRGAGLGLAIASGFVEAHGGKIEVQSKPGQGTIFSFTLPRGLPTG